jgi:hypothetical protein
MFSNDFFSEVSGKRVRDVRACLKAYSLALELFDKYVRLPSAVNAHYPPKTFYTGLMHLSMNGGYAQSGMMDLDMRYGFDAPCGGAFLYRLKKVGYNEWYSRLRDANDSILSLVSKWGLLKRSVMCAVDYTKIPYYGSFNRYVVRSKHERGTNQFYEYASMSIVEDGLKLCVYSRPVTLLDAKGDVVREMVEEARWRGVKIRYLLLDRAFFTVECMNLLKGMGIDFIMPAVKNERVRAVMETATEKSFQFSIHDSNGDEASFTMLLHRRESDGTMLAFATSMDDPGILEVIPDEYRRRWGIETSFRKVKEVHGMTTSPSPAIRMLYFMTAMILYNLWQVINLMLRVKDHHNDTAEDKRYHVTIPFMVTIFCAHLNGRV